MADRKQRKSVSSSTRKKSYTKAKAKAHHTSHVTQARLLAWKILQLVGNEGIYVHDAAHRMFNQGDYPETERSFALLLAAGVVSTEGILDSTLNAILAHPHDIDDRVRDALRISSYELLFLDKNSYAAVDQGVELVRAIAPRATGVANFVLRRVAQQASQPLAKVLADLSDQELACAFGFPDWLVAHLIAQKGRTWTESYLHFSNQSAPIFFFINEARVQPEALLALLAEHNIAVDEMSSVSTSSICAFPAYKFQKRKSVQHPLVQGLLDECAIIISDMSAQMIASLALPRIKPASVLEIGSGRGVKTIMLQVAARARYQSFLKLDSVEINQQKITIAQNQLKKAHIPKVCHWVCDAQDLHDFTDKSYEVVFIDAPCSGLGTLRRHPEIRWRLQSSDSATLHTLNSKIIHEAARKVAPSGQLTYATCTITKEENQAVIDEFLASPLGASFSIEKCFETPLVSEGPDLHYACVLRRQSV